VTRPELFQRFPKLTLPWISLGASATPVERAAAFGDRVWVKRDDLTAATYGGNKVRKLELVLADARARGAMSLLTMGGTGSNHVLATAIYARQLGFAATHAVLFPQPRSEDVDRKLAAYASLGVRTVRAAKPLVPFAFVGATASSIARGTRLPYVIGPGASSALGTCGYVSAGLELARQIEAGEAPRFDAVYVPLGSGGTVAGLALGFALAGLPMRILAVRTVPAPWVSLRGTISLARKTAALLARSGADLGVGGGAGSRIDISRYLDIDIYRYVDLIDDQLGAGYGEPTEAAQQAVVRARDAGLTVETTYSGKALAALLAAQAGGRDAGRDVLFWLTYSAAPPPAP
jgi:1-aminocyclopropane-1-carboxylate deaminase/D-cysteine desulfhydrase-like pyridoxal-dependent ACC family enzyme